MKGVKAWYCGCIDQPHGWFTVFGGEFFATSRYWPENLAKKLARESPAASTSVDMKTKPVLFSTTVDIFFL